MTTLALTTEHPGLIVGGVRIAQGGSAAAGALREERRVRISASEGRL